jgi:hypothetical protein
MIGEITKKYNISTWIAQLEKNIKLELCYHDINGLMLWFYFQNKVYEVIDS